MVTMTIDGVEFKYETDEFGALFGQVTVSNDDASLLLTAAAMKEWIEQLGYKHRRLTE